MAIFLPDVVAVQARGSFLSDGSIHRRAINCKWFRSCKSENTQDDHSRSRIFSVHCSYIFFQHLSRGPIDPMPKKKENKTQSPSY